MRSPSACGVQDRGPPDGASFFIARHKRADGATAL
jgi:hypothetical protein